MWPRDIEAKAMSNSNTAHKLDSSVAFDMAEKMGGKVYLLNVVPSAFEGARLAAAGPMMAAVPLVVTDDGCPLVEVLQLPSLVS